MMAERNQAAGTPEELARGLIGSARLDARPVPEAVRQQLFGAISAAGAVGSGGMLAVAWSALRRLGLVKWFAATTALGVAGIGAYATIRRSPAPAVVVSRASQPAPVVARPEPSANPALAIEASSAPPSPGIDATATGTSSVAPTTQRRREAATSKAGASGAPSIEGEVAALDRVRAALAGGEPQRALTLLDQYDQTFPQGALRQEATYLRIQALARAGQRAQARDLAARFLAAHPKSPDAAQLRALLEP